MLYCCRRITILCPIEGEALAAIDALDKSPHFILGCENLLIAVDHKPLIKVSSDRCLDNIPNPCLRNLKEKSLRYPFQIVHVTGLNLPLPPKLHYSRIRASTIAYLQSPFPIVTVEQRSAPRQSNDFLKAILIKMVPFKLTSNFKELSYNTATLLITTLSCHHLNVSLEDPSENSSLST